MPRGLFPFHVGQKNFVANLGHKHECGVISRTTRLSALTAHRNRLEVDARGIGPCGVDVLTAYNDERVEFRRTAVSYKLCTPLRVGDCFLSSTFSFFNFFGLSLPYR
jgi:hypothetical protein